jgi:hypothetical protein
MIRPRSYSVAGYMRYGGIVWPFRSVSRPVPDILTEDPPLPTEIPELE